MRYHPEVRAIAPVHSGRPNEGRPRVRRKAAVLVEFALISLFLYLLLAVTIEMGRSLYSAQLLQQAADVMAREISRTPLPPDRSLVQVLYERRLPSNARVLRDIYSEDFLVIDIDRQLKPGQTFVDFFADKPMVNRQLFSLMIYEQVDGQRLLRYPGALFASRTAPSGLTVAIPMVVARAGDGTETIEWVRVVEEVENPAAASTQGTSQPAAQQQTPAQQQFLPPVGSGSSAQQLLPPVGSGSSAQQPLLPPVGSGPSQQPAQATVNVTSAFSIASPQRGLVAVRINYPYQAAALSAYRSGAHPIEAHDGGVRVQPRAGGFDPGSAPVDSGQTVGTFAGPFGLGRQFALGKTVRPYRKLLTAQAIYRREVFGSPEVIPNNP